MKHDPESFETQRGTWIIECGSCGQYHREDWGGDCRDDSERILDPDSGECADGSFIHDHKPGERTEAAIERHRARRRQDASQGV